MSFRIETIADLRNPTNVEKCLDRLRRTTRPAKFVFKVRCKALNGKPILITAPPGRKVKSSLVRDLRLGTPTLKGMVRREGKILYFTFTSEVSKSTIRRWIGYCLHKAKSPVPLNNIIIECPSDSKKKKRPAPKELSRVSKDTQEIKPPEFEDVEDWEPEEESSEEEDGLADIHHNLEAANQADRDDAVADEMTSINEAIKQHVKVSTLKKLHKYLQALEAKEDDIDSHQEMLENNEDNITITHEKLHTITEKSISQQQQLTAITFNTKQQIKNWNALLQQISNSDITFASIQNILADSDLPTQKILRSIQRLTDEWDAFQLIRNVCSDQQQKLLMDLQKKQATVDEFSKKKESLLNEISQLQEQQHNIQHELQQSQIELHAAAAKYWTKQRSVLILSAQAILEVSLQDPGILAQKLEVLAAPLAQELALTIRLSEEKYLIYCS